MSTERDSVAIDGVQELPGRAAIGDDHRSFRRVVVDRIANGRLSIGPEVVAGMNRDNEYRDAREPTDRSHSAQRFEPDRIGGPSADSNGPESGYRLGHGEGQKREQGNEKTRSDDQALDKAAFGTGKRVHQVKKKVCSHGGD